MNKYVILGYLEKKSAWYHNPLNTAAIGAGIGGLGGGLGRYFLDPKANIWNILNSSALGAVGGGGLGYLGGKYLWNNPQQTLINKDIDNEVAKMENIKKRNKGNEYLSNIYKNLSPMFPEENPYRLRDIENEELNKYLSKAYYKLKASQGKFNPNDIDIPPISEKQLQSMKNDMPEAYNFGIEQMKKEFEQSPDEIRNLKTYAYANYLDIQNKIKELKSLGIIK